MDLIDIQKVIDSLASWKPWVVIGIVIASGAVGGWAQKYSVAIANGKGPAKLPFLGYIVVGVAAALGVMFVLTSDALLRLISFAVVAGFGGKAVLSAMEEKLKATEVQAKGREVAEKAEKVAENVNKLREDVESRTKEMPEVKLGPEFEIIAEETKDLVSQIANLRKVL